MLINVRSKKGDFTCSSIKLLSSSVVKLMCVEVVFILLMLDVGGGKPAARLVFGVNCSQVYAMES